MLPETEARIRELEAKVAAQQKTIDTLVETLETAQADAAGSLSAVFSQHITLERIVAERTANLEHALEQNRVLNGSLTSQTRALGEAEARQRTMLDGLKEQVCILGPGGRIVTGNRAWARVIAALDSEHDNAWYGPIGRSIFKPGQAEIEDLLAVVAGDRPAGEEPKEVTGETRDGRWMMVFLARLDEGAEGSFILSHHDVTVQKRTELELERLVHELSAERSLLAGVLNNVPHGIFWKDRDSIFRGANRYLVELAHLDSERDIVGKSDFELPWKDQAEWYRQHDRQVVETTEPILDLDETLTDAEGGLRILQTSKVPMRGENGEVTGILGLIRDVTETRAMQDELNQSRRLESIGRLAAGVAHEINTPMQYVGDNLHFLGRAIEKLLALGEGLRQAVGNPDLPEEVRRPLEAMLAAARLPLLQQRCPQALASAHDGVATVSSIVQAMKGFAHPGDKAKAPFDLNHGIETTVTVSRNEWKYCADLETDLDPDLPPVLGLGGELNQVFLNIIVNAAHAIEDRFGDQGEKQGRILITTCRRGDWVEVRIGDNGAGIPEDVQRRIFEPFFTTKEVGRGSGQGLAIARSVIVDRHHGEIRFESKPGEGTTFVLRLPIARPETESEPGAAAA